MLYRHAGGNRDGAFTDWFSFTVTSGARPHLTAVSGVFWVVVELTDRELPALDANIPLTVTHGDLATITAINLHISQAGMQLPPPRRSCFHPCLSVCLLAGLLRTTDHIFMKFCGMVEYNSVTQGPVD